MKQIMKKAMYMMLVLVLAFAVLPNHVIQAKAASKPGLPISSWSNYFVSSYKRFGLGLDFVEEDADVKVSSSNKKIATVKYDKAEKTIWVTAKKPGKVTVTCTVKQDGKKYITKCKYTVLKYTNPLSKLKLGNKSYKSKYNKNTEYEIPVSKKKQTLSVKVKKGYEITDIYGIKNGKMKDIKNNSKIQTSKFDVIYIRIQDKNGNINYIGMFPRKN